MYKTLLIIANKLEKIAFRMKKRINRKIAKSFFDRYSIQDGTMKNKTDIRYNPYEGTPLLLIDALINSQIISRTESILDIGCGAGVFLIYLASKGFENLQGIEMDKDLYSLCQNNIKTFMEKNDNMQVDIKVYNGNATEERIDDSVTCFYLFNTFYDKETYLEWISKVKESLARNKRKIKIILLYPTVASMGAMRSCNWLNEKRRVVCPMINCKKCMNFLVYESEE